MILIAKISIADYNESFLVLGLQRREEKVGNKRGVGTRRKMSSLDDARSGKRARKDTQYMSEQFQKT